MRTTLSLDDDVAAALRHVQRSSGRRWKDVVNEAIRAGLASGDAARKQTSKAVPRTSTVRLGGPMIGDIANVHEVLSLVEGDDRR